MTSERKAETRIAELEGFLRQLQTTIKARGDGRDLRDAGYDRMYEAIDAVLRAEDSA